MTADKPDDESVLAYWLRGVIKGVEAAKEKPDEDKDKDGD